MPDIDLSGQPHWISHDRTILPQVEEDLVGIRRAVVAWIGRLNAGVETYAPVPDIDQGGTLELSQAQARHLHAELGKLISKWDTEPRDLIAEADEILRGAGHIGRNRASKGYEVTTDGSAVYVYHQDGRGPIGADDNPSHLYAYAGALKDAGYTDVTVNAATEEQPARRVRAVPPAAESF
ncbi:hypothetical protein [Streptomyces sp. NPDC088752]|uniref:hypothetical protein n=1 Tax=Streptomyces sp. NPDC088752 TaxID=3154963 RepID=UPI00344A0723